MLRARRGSGGDEGMLWDDEELLRKRRAVEEEEEGKLRERNIITGEITWSIRKTRERETTKSWNEGDAGKEEKDE